MSAETPAAGRAGHSVRLVVLATVIVLILGAAGWALGRLTAPVTSFPSAASPEAGFARDMQVHHLQAVEMSFLVRDRTEDPEIRQLAYDIARTQQHQAGQMYGWLSIWGLPQASPEPAMAWMDEDAGHSSPHDTGQQSTAMPGMATAAQLEALTDAEGSEAEQLYLELMIPHHQAGTTMAQAVLDRTDNEAVRALAQSIATSQQTEIRYLEQLLRTR